MTTDTARPDVSPAAGTPMLPLPYRVAARRDETADVRTIALAPVAAAIPVPGPGQFTMLYRHGVGEVPVSVSGPPARGTALVQTVRAVGAVTRSLYAAAPGDLVGVRGPFGTGWCTGRAAGQDVLLVAGGLGLAPLRPLVLHFLRHRDDHGRLTLVAGARRPEDLLYRAELDRWSATPGLDLELTVDHATPGWDGAVGFVTEPLARMPIDPARTIAFVCGPEPMMRFSAHLLAARGVPPARIQLSLERNMRCGIGQCGHCQLGPVLLCRDGPVLDYARAGELMETREL